METEAFLSKADLIVTDGKVATLDAAGTIAEAIAIKGERILAVGRTEEITLSLSVPRTQEINAAGRLVVPGLIDGHAHMDREGLKEVHCPLSQAADRSTRSASVFDISRKKRLRENGL